MKKGFIFIICMVACLSLVGGAIALSYYKAPAKETTITADSYMALEIGGTESAYITVAPNSKPVYNIYAQITHKSAGAASEKAHLNINIATADEKDLSGITFGLYTDPDCEVPVTGCEGLTVDAVSGELAISVSNIAESTQYYLQLQVGNVEDADELALMQGTIDIELIRQA